MNISNQDIVQSLRTIFDKCQKHVCALNSIGLDYWINFWSYAYKHYFQEIRQSKQASTELSSWKDFIDFLQKCYLVLENLLSNLNTFSNKPKYMSDHKNTKLKNLLVKNNSLSDKACVLCKSRSHFSFAKCDLFLKQNEDDRYLT